MTNKQISFALVGAGNVAKKYVEAFGQIKEAKLAGVITRTASKAQAFARDNNITHWATDMAALFGKVDIDAVIIAAPSGSHSELTIEAAKYGKHILCEKPLDVTLEKIDAMTRACANAGVRLGCAYQHRTFEHNQATYEMLQSGGLGRVYIANAFLKNFRPQQYYDSAAWRGTWGLDGGGPFMQQAAHTIDLMVWMMGRARKVIASTKTTAHKVEVEDMGHAIVEYENGAQGIIEASTVVKPGYPNRIEIHGEKGSIILSEGGFIDWQVKGIEKPKLKGIPHTSGSADPMAISSRGHELLIRDFIKAIQQNRPPLVPPESARLSVELILAIYESAGTGKAVEIK